MLIILSLSVKTIFLAVGMRLATSATNELVSAFRSSSDSKLKVTGTESDFLIYETNKIPI